MFHLLLVDNLPMCPNSRPPEKMIIDYWCVPLWQNNLGDDSESNNDRNASDLVQWHCQEGWLPSQSTNFMLYLQQWATLYFQNTVFLACVAVHHNEGALFYLAEGPSVKVCHIMHIMHLQSAKSLPIRIEQGCQGTWGRFNIHMIVVSKDHCFLLHTLSKRWQVKAM